MIMREQQRIDFTEGNSQLLQPDRCATSGVNQQLAGPAPINVLGPNRSALGVGTPVPSRVTLKSPVIRASSYRNL